MAVPIVFIGPGLEHRHVGGIEIAGHLLRGRYVDRNYILLDGIYRDFTVKI